MDINDFEIKIKKYDEKKNVVYVNLVIFKELEIRNWVVRYTETKYSSNPIWLVNPPSVLGRNKKMFWIVYLKNPPLWKLLNKKIIDMVKEYTDLL
jgi:hypothetical protein